MHAAMDYRYNLGSAFAAVAHARPDAPALLFGPDDAVTFGDLHRLAGRIARLLRDRGIGRGDVVTLFSAKRAEGFAAMLACLTLGAPYVNLDDENPAPRLGRILATCRPRAVLTDTALRPESAAACRAAGAEPVDLTAGLPDAGTAAADGDEPIGSDIAYLMFTSGSTGTPKGVAIGHASVLNLIGWARQEYALGPGDRLTNVNPLYFDNSVFDFYGALFNGAALAPLPRPLLQQPRALVERVEALGCTLWFSVPSLLIYLTTMRALTAGDWGRMRTIAFGGEGYPKSELKKLHELFGHRLRLVNVYGPTECTCICSAYDVGAGDLADPAGLPPIGRLAANFRGLLLDGDRPVAPGETGELCLLGPNVGIGYYGDPVRTAERFTQNPLNTVCPERIYRTGDLMRQDPADALLRFAGRSDNQIKHLGYRIEPEEIEAALNGLEGVVQCAVLYRRIRSNYGHLVAFVAADRPLEEEALRTALAAALPRYMIPQRIAIRATLPKNANGKVDRKQLAEEI